jgi:hypothetical protein
MIRNITVVIPIILHMDENIKGRISNIVSDLSDWNFKNVLAYINCTKLFYSDVSIHTNTVV